MSKKPDHLETPGSLVHSKVLTVLVQSSYAHGRGIQEVNPLSNAAKGWPSTDQAWQILPPKFNVQLPTFSSQPQNWPCGPQKGRHDAPSRFPRAPLKLTEVHNPRTLLHITRSSPQYHQVQHEYYISITRTSCKHQPKVLLVNPQPSPPSPPQAPNFPNTLRCIT